MDDFFGDEDYFSLDTLQEVNYVAPSSSVSQSVNAVSVPVTSGESSQQVSSQSAGQRALDMDDDDRLLAELLDDIEQVTAQNSVLRSKPKQQTVTTAGSVPTSSISSATPTTTTQNIHNYDGAQLPATHPVGSTPTVQSAQQHQIPASHMSQNVPQEMQSGNAHMIYQQPVQHQNMVPQMMQQIPFQGMNSSQQIQNTSQQQVFEPQGEAPSSNKYATSRQQNPASGNSPLLQAALARKPEAVQTFNNANYQQSTSTQHHTTMTHGSVQQHQMPVQHLGTHQLDASAHQLSHLHHQVSQSNIGNNLSMAHPNSVYASQGSDHSSMRQAGPVQHFMPNHQADQVSLMYQQVPSQQTGHNSSTQNPFHYVGPGATPSGQGTPQSSAPLMDNQLVSLPNHPGGGGPVSYQASVSMTPQIPQSSQSSSWPVNTQSPINHPTSVAANQPNNSTTHRSALDQQPMRSKQETPQMMTSSPIVTQSLINQYATVHQGLPSEQQFGYNQGASNMGYQRQSQPELAGQPTKEGDFSSGQMFPGQNLMGNDFNVSQHNSVVPMQNQSVGQSMDAFATFSDHSYFGTPSQDPYSQNNSQDNTQNQGFQQVWQPRPAPSTHNTVSQTWNGGRQSVSMEGQQAFSQTSMQQMVPSHPQPIRKIVQQGQNHMMYTYDPTTGNVINVQRLMRRQIVQRDAQGATSIRTVMVPVSNQQGEGNHFQQMQSSTQSRQQAQFAQHASQQRVYHVQSAYPMTPVNALNVIRTVNLQGVPGNAQQVVRQTPVLQSVGGVQVPGQHLSARYEQGTQSQTKERNGPTSGIPQGVYVETRPTAQSGPQIHTMAKAPGQTSTVRTIHAGVKDPSKQQSSKLAEVRLEAAREPAPVLGVVPTYKLKTTADLEKEKRQEMVSAAKDAQMKRLVTLEGWKQMNNWLKLSNTAEKATKMLQLLKQISEAEINVDLLLNSNVDTPRFLSSLRKNGATTEIKKLASDLVGKFKERVLKKADDAKSDKADVDKTEQSAKSDDGTKNNATGDNSPNLPSTQEDPYNFPDDLSEDAASPELGEGLELEHEIKRGAEVASMAKHDAETGKSPKVPENKSPEKKTKKPKTRAKVYRARARQTGFEDEDEQIDEPEEKPEEKITAKVEKSVPAKVEELVEEQPGDITSTSFKKSGKERYDVLESVKEVKVPSEKKLKPGIDKKKEKKVKSHITEEKSKQQLEPTKKKPDEVKKKEPIKLKNVALSTSFMEALGPAVPVTPVKKKKVEIKKEPSKEDRKKLKRKAKDEVANDPLENILRVVGPIAPKPKSDDEEDERHRRQTTKDEPPPAKKRRCVRFETDDKLVEVRYFERDNEPNAANHDLTHEQLIKRDRELDHYPRNAIRDEENNLQWRLLPVVCKPYRVVRTAESVKEELRQKKVPPVRFVPGRTEEISPVEPPVEDRFGDPHQQVKIISTIVQSEVDEPTDQSEQNEPETSSPFPGYEPVMYTPTASVQEPVRYTPARIPTEDVPSTASVVYAHSSQSPEYSYTPTPISIPSTSNNHPIEIVREIPLYPESDPTTVRTIEDMETPESPPPYTPESPDKPSSDYKSHDPKTNPTSTIIIPTTPEKEFPEYTMKYPEQNYDEPAPPDPRQHYSQEYPNNEDGRQSFCRFFRTARGCSKGEHCRFSHTQPPLAYDRRDGPPLRDGCLPYREEYPTRGGPGGRGGLLQRPPDAPPPIPDRDGPSGNRDNRERGPGWEHSESGAYDSRGCSQRGVPFGRWDRGRGGHFPPRGERGGHFAPRGERGGHFRGAGSSGPSSGFRGNFPRGPSRGFGPSRPQRY